MKKFKRFTAFFAAAMIAAMGMAGCGNEAPKETNAEQNQSATVSDSGSGSSAKTKEKVTIAIAQFADHGSLDNCREGFIEGLKEAGYIEGENLEILFENAHADTGVAAQIASNFTSKDIDLFCAIATPMAQSAYGNAMGKNIPVIYTAVTDPVAAELAAEDRMPVGDVTGTSDKLPVEKQLEMIRKVLPDAKKIGIMYSTSEVNSISAIEEYKRLAPNYGFEIVESGISTSADIPLAAESLIAKVDCLNNLTDNTVVNGLSVILEKANTAGIPIFGSEIEQVKRGCLATVGLDYIALGKKTGEIAAKVLDGEKKASEIPYEIIAEGELYLNIAAAEKLQIEIPEELKKEAAQIMEEITE